MEQPKLTPIGAKTWKLLEPYYCNLDFYCNNEMKSKSYKIRVPRNFITDLASTPRLLWNIVPPFGKYSGPSVIHDWLYSSECPLKIKRKEADLIFLRLMKKAGVIAWKRQAMYRAVRIFGGSHYRKGA